MAGVRVLERVEELSGDERVGNMRSVRKCNRLIWTHVDRAVSRLPRPHMQNDAVSSRPLPSSLPL